MFILADFGVKRGRTGLLDITRTSNSSMVMREQKSRMIVRHGGARSFDCGLIVRGGSREKGDRANGRTRLLRLTVAGSCRATDD